MDLRKLKTLIDLVSESGISELEVTEGENKVRIVKDGASTYALPNAPAKQAAAPPRARTSPTTDEPEEEAQPEKSAAPSGYTVKSLMVGTFYRAPSPEAPPFVQVGDSVKKGQTIGIIEAMKLLNEIEAETAGVLKKILVENGQAVDYGQPLFIID